MKFHVEFDLTVSDEAYEAARAEAGPNAVAADMLPELVRESVTDLLDGESWEPFEVGPVQVS